MFFLLILQKITSFDINQVENVRILHYIKNEEHLVYHSQIKSDKKH